MTLPLRNAKLRTAQGTFAWREVGSGSTVLFLHGSWQDSSQWIPLMQQLGQQFHCIAPDLLGFGESSRLEKGAYSIDGEVSALAEYLAAIRVQPQILVAESLGAWVAVRYSLQHPDTIQGLVLMAPEGLSAPTLDQRWRGLRWLASPWALRFWGLRLVTPLVKLLGGDRWLHQVWQKRQQLRGYRAASRLLFQRRKAVLRSEWLNAALPHLKTPVLLLHPEQATQHTQLANSLFYDLAPQAQLMPIPGDESTAWAHAIREVQAFAKTGTINAILP
ncbi:MAG: alpha/beta hydrolase [Leptolyngbya sp. SIO1E4]|nr:alpha/beta hydrolase [Leptolyngbya sp. SIO1E4]